MAERKAKTPFVSCIKIKGIHLLPPVITQKRRAELQGYKQQAVKLEKRLKNCRDLKKNLEDLLNMQPLTDRPYSEISFRDDNHVEDLGITDNTKDYNSPSETKAIRKITLSRDIIDVTQYNNDGIKVYSDVNCETFDQGHHLNNNNMNKSRQIESTPTNRNNSFEDSDLNSSRSSKCNIDESSISLNISASDISPRLAKSPKPRLIRSNSYTLETPSPILLAHLEKTERSNKQDKSKNLEDIKNLSISRNWSSLENNYVPFENSEFNSISTVYDTNFNEPDKKGTESNTSIDKKEQPSIEKNKSPAINVIQTDISVQNITVNANEEIINDALDQNVVTSDSQLLQVLKTLPEVYAKQIIELIESQKEKQKLKDNKDESSNNLQNSNLKNDNVSFEGSTTSISPSQSIYYSLASCDTLRPMSNSSVRLIDLECDETGVTEEKSESAKKDITEYYVHEELRTGMNVNRELFPQLDEATINTIKREWAASVIGAHVKGYLTRRLLKTERVQSLIETIKDALMCALQLHNSENIDESDVELHRRLINQVSAACFTFHDIFFTLSVQEQMLIISTDRQRKMEKAKRPASAPASRRSKSSSNRSTPRQRLSSHSQSLTKV